MPLALAVIEGVGLVLLVLAASLVSVPLGLAVAGLCLVAVANALPARSGRLKRSGKGPS